MVGQRRFGPLMALVLCGLVVIWLRLFQVQILEHDLWAREAANLVRQSSVVPYQRGRILDRKGTLLVKDEEFYQVELVYRDFRRGHPLGQVAHARSALELRAISLSEALHNLEPWAHELITLSVKELEGFARGERLVTASLSVPACEDPDEERRSSRASDLRFYVGELLGAKRSELARLRKLRNHPDGALPLLDVLATWRAEEDARRGVGEVRRDLLDHVREGLSASRSHLIALAELLQLDGESAEPGAFPVGDPFLERLLADLEDARRSVEDSAAEELFQWAAGFPAGRLSTETLASQFDLDWIAAVLRWDARRLSEWIDGRRADWLAWRDRLALPTVFAQLELADDSDRLAESLLTGLSDLLTARSPVRWGSQDSLRDWRHLNQVVVVSELDSLFDLPRGLRMPLAPRRVLALQDRALAKTRWEGADQWDLFGHVYELPESSDGSIPEGMLVDMREAGSEEEAEAVAAAADAAPGLDPPALAGLWSAAMKERSALRQESTLELAIHLVDSWEMRLQETIERSFANVEGRALEFKPERKDRALERVRHILRDRGSRPFGLRKEPSYDVVHRLTRYPEQYRGFYVRDSMRRVMLEFDEYGAPIAEQLIGHVRASSLQEVLGQKPLERKLRELQRKTQRTREDRRQIEVLSARLYRWDESHGGAGIESTYDDVLRGQNGYRETEGMQERKERGKYSLSREPVDGQDVHLTLDLDLQRAALDTLEHPEHEVSDEKRDDIWLRNPVGAIVLAELDGEVLVAASVPTVPHPVNSYRDGQRRIPMDRTLRRPTFHPPGSTFKPLIAAWSLEYMGLDPEATFECLRQPEEDWANYMGLRCNSMWGHGAPALHEALMRSCNVYFAHLGEQCSAEQLIEICDTFGLGQPSGVQAREDASFRGLADLIRKGHRRTAHQRRQAGNGLAVIEATPMQMARAFIGLATGSLPRMRFAQRIGGEPVPGESSELPISDANMERVRATLKAAITDRLGTAFGKGLDEESLGFTVALKTGSADYKPFDPREESEENKLRKHTWVAGWMPSEDPVAVFVIYLHDVSETSSHSAVYVARQFLRSQAVREYLTESGVSVTGGG